jgi:hypothetical protein
MLHAHHAVVKINKVFMSRLKYFLLAMKNQKKNRKERRKEILAEILYQQSL